MSALPGREEFQRYLEQEWQLAWEGGSLPVTLVEVNQGTAMNARYECFNLVFAQPAGYQMPQHTYSLRGPDNQQLPELLLCPIGPEEDGERHLLQAVFHLRRPTQSP
ncbi:hypothetical protein [Pseudomonas sp. SCB32]|uniref:DUF6916 family protein n=1 Tax=Pseudomonas sp. SCB32 TaxID=2653853 RepID=UPI001265396A|nr:hypothetical protein [Pseudomonas sp. SCB32]